MGAGMSMGAGTTKRTVLLADDDAALRRLVGVTLGQDRFALLMAGDGEEALAVARAERPETILLDVNMPRLNGLEVCRALKADPATAHIKILILTGNGSDADRREALAAGADGYLAKPFSPIALLEWMQDDD
jgi:CheY-like chemotaxis protein